MNLEQLHAYLDGELTPQERLQVEKQMAQDPALAKAYADLVAVDAEIGAAWPVPQPGASQPDWAAKIVGDARRARRGRLIAFTASAAGIAAALLLTFLPSVGPQPSDVDFFTDDEDAGYVYWESDGETYGTGDLTDLEDQILDVLGAT